MSAGPAVAGPPAVDLVNAALLGTDRRPVPVPPGADPAGWLLEAAARRRAQRLVAAGTSAAPLPPAGPAPTRPAPPLAARAVLDELLLTPSNAVVNLWLREALDAGTGLAPEHWTPLLERARRATDLDRRRLGAALAAPGLWFAGHNPAWAAVVRAATSSDGDRSASRDAIFTAEQSRQAVAALAAGTQEVGGVRALGRLIGSRLPLTAYPLLADAGPPPNDSARVGLAAAEEVLWARWGLAVAFDPDRVPPERRAVPLLPLPGSRP